VTSAVEDVVGLQEYGLVTAEAALIRDPYAATRTA